MADTKLTALTADATPTSDDLVYAVNDPGGTPASRKVTAANLVTKAHGLSDGVIKVATGTMAVATAGTDYTTPSSTEAFTNKTFNADGSGNSITNIENADIKAAAAIAVNKLAAVTASRALASDGSGFITPATTTATELGYVNGVTSAIQTQLDARVAKSLYDANTILAANSDDTPAAVTVAEQRIVGRKTGGSITALTGAETALISDDRWHIPLLLTCMKATESGDWTRVQNSGGWTGGYYTNSTTPVDGDYIEYANVRLPAGGTWTIELLYNATSGMGIIDVVIGGVSAGTVDCYSAGSAAALGVVSTTFSPTGGLTTVKLLLNGKNGSSSGYLTRISALNFTRTA